MHNRSEQMLYNTNPVANQVRSARPYASIVDPEDPEAGNLLKVLAQKRVRSIAHNNAAREEGYCNMTVSKIQPAMFATNSRVVLKFTVVALDCVISSVLIGSYNCTNITIQTNTTFSCTTGYIPISGKYIPKVTLGDGSTVYYGESVTVAPASATTSAMVAFRFLANPAIYTFESLMALLAQLAGIDVSSIIELEHIIVPAVRRSTEFSEDHDTRLSITSTTVPAADIAQNMIGLIPKSEENFLAIGVKVTYFGVAAICDSNGECDCAPNYAPPTCETKAPCPNDCTSHGDCVDGQLGRVCSCIDGFTGRDCSTPTCNSSCSYHGSCLLQSGAVPECQCDPGWQGENCAESVPCLNDCSGFGTCVEGRCACSPGRTGDDCGSVESSIVDNANQDQGRDDTVLGVVIAVVGVILIVAVGLVIYVIIERRRQV